ncbi:hypothetical protein [Lactococcus protaetiae]|nr:hypothetical protein [Lactococcus protaetiae]
MAKEKEKLTLGTWTFQDGTVMTYEEFKEWCRNNYLPSEVGKAYARGNC